jgi:hypothetical protein
MAGKKGNPNLTKGGTALPGAGRPKGSYGVNKPLREALAQYETDSGKCFVLHYIKQAFKDKKTACDLAGRLYPSLKSIEGNLELQHKILNVIGINPIQVPDGTDNKS